MLQCISYCYLPSFGSHTKSHRISHKFTIDMCPNLNVLCRRQYVRGNVGLLLYKFPSTILIAWLNVILRRYDNKDTHNLVHRKMTSSIITEHYRTPNGPSADAETSYFPLHEASRVESDVCTVEPRHCNWRIQRRQFPAATRRDVHV